MYLDNDLYQWLMSQVIWFEFPDLKVMYDHTNRADPFPVDKSLYAKISERLAERPSYNDLKILDATGYFKDDYLNALGTFEPPELYMTFKNLTAKVIGQWYSAIFAETPILSILAEHRFKSFDRDCEIKAGWEKLREKREFLKKHPQLKIMEFGTRRRASAVWQRVVLSELVESTNNIIGSSNVLLASEFGIPAMGTQAHQMYMVLEPIYGRVGSQRKVIELWNKYYPGKQMFLTDTFGTENAMNIVSKQELETLKGYRQDSGSPNIWVDRIKHALTFYGLDWKSFDYTFSDNLDCQKMLDIWQYHHSGLGPITFGVGTNFTNDMYTAAPNMVMKPTKVLYNRSWQDCYKKSDDPMKATKV